MPPVTCIWPDTLDTKLPVWKITTDEAIVSASPTPPDDEVNDPLPDNVNGAPTPTLTELLPLGHAARHRQ